MFYCVRKLAGLLLSWVCSVHAFELPVDDEVSIEYLSNGVQLWLKQHNHPSQLISCRIVARHQLDVAPQIFSFNDCPADWFEDELPSFIDHCRESMQKQAECEIAVVAVGDFNSKELEPFLTQAFDVFTQRRPSIKPQSVVINPSDHYDIVSLSLFYPTVLQELKTDQDLKKLWILYLLQSICEDHFHKAIVEESGEWIGHPESKYFLPFCQTVARGKQLMNRQQPAGMLEACLNAMVEIKKRGFTDSELSNAKAKLQKSLMSYYHQNPDNNALADYYTSHFALGIGCPNYDVFMTTSLNLVAEISMQDMIDAIGYYFKDEARRVEFKAPRDFPVTENAIREILASHSTDSLSIETKEDSSGILDENDPYLQLPITEGEAQLIYEIIDTMASNNLAKLLLKKSEMEKKGRKINHVHPLRFLGTVFSNPHLKKCMVIILDSFFKWDGFISGISERLDEEYEKNNLLPYVPGLCQIIKANPDQVRIYVQKREWEKLVKYLIKLSN